VARVAILGSTGKLGHLLVARAIELGFRVNALTRDPSRIKRFHESLTVIEGDAARGTGLGALISGCKNVVAAIGSHEPVVGQCIANLVRELQARQMLARFVLVSCSALDAVAPNQKPGLFGRILQGGKTKHFDDLAAAESVVSVSGLEYVILRATRLTDDSSRQQVLTVPHHEQPPAQISRTALAHFVMDLVGQPQWRLGEVTIGTRR
jgi:uncharacterized protein YbjT (DUF2867 family)